MLFIMLDDCSNKWKDEYMDKDEVLWNYFA